MKNVTNNQMSIQWHKHSNRFSTFLSLLTSLLLPALVFGQYPPSIITPATVEWNFQTPTIYTGLNFGTKEDWALSTIQASDGSIVTVGFTEREITGPEFHPSIFKYIPGPDRLVQWEAVPTDQLNIGVATAGTGGFTDVFESVEGNGHYFYACGMFVPVLTQKPTAVIAKFESATGALVYFKNITQSSTAFIESRFVRMLPYYDNTGAVTAIYIAGQSSIAASANNDGIRKGTIFKLSPNGTLDTSFDGDGWRQYPALFLIDGKKTSFRDLAAAPPVGTLSNGIIVVGSVTNYQAAWNSQPEKDIFMLRVDENSGNVNWTKRYTEAGLPNYIDPFYTALPSTVGTTDNNIPSVPITEPESTNSEEAFSIKKMQDGKFVVLCKTDFLELVEPYTPSGANHPFEEEYTDNDMVLTKVNPQTGAIESALNIGRSTAIDGWNMMANTPNCNEIYINASFYDVANPNETQASVIRVDYIPNTTASAPAFLYQWRKNTLGKNGTGLTDEPQICIFGICLTSDKGVVVCGNNYTDDENYELIKFSNDQQVNSAFTLTSPVITAPSSPVNWNTYGSLIKVKGEVHIKSGATLEIPTGVTVEFANTYTTNDWRTLVAANNTGGLLSRIVVEPGGKLILNGCVLKGLTTNLCPSGTQESMWEGIVLMGTPTAGQTLGALAQGMVEIKNNAQIKDAYMGICVGDKSYNSDGRSNPSGTGGGGIIYSHNPLNSTVSHFLNCRHAIYYSPVTSTATPPYLIDNTNFECNRVMLDPNFVDPNGNGRLGQRHFFSSANRDKLTLNKCSFKGSLLQLSPKLRSTAVENFDAQIKILRCKFQNLYNGVVAGYSTNVTENTAIDNSTFTNLQHGAYITAGSLHSITLSTFSQIPSSLFNDASYGVRFNNASKLYISDANNFSSTSGTAGGTYGVIVANSGTYYSEIGRNTFNNITFGVQTEGANGGLQILCNNYTGNEYDWSINPSGAGSFPNQGACGSTAIQAGNIFNDPKCPTGGGTAESNIKSKVPFTYYARPNTNEIPTCVSNGTGGNALVTVTSCGANINPNSCGGGVARLAQNDNASVWNKEYAYIEEINHYLGAGDKKNALSLIEKHFKEDKNQYLSMLINIGEYEAAQNELVSLHNIEQATELVALYQVLIDLGKSGKSIMELNASQEAILKNITEGHSPARLLAQNILTFVKGYVFEHPIEMWGKSTNTSENLTITTEETISVYPNPFTSNFEIEIPESHEYTTVNLYDVTGRILISKNIANENRLQIEGSSLVNGFYFIEVKGEHKSLTRKIIKN